MGFAHGLRVKIRRRRENSADTCLCQWSRLRCWAAAEQRFAHTPLPQPVTCTLESTLKPTRDLLSRATHNDQISINSVSSLNRLTYPILSYPAARTPYVGHNYPRRDAINTPKVRLRGPNAPRTHTVRDHCPRRRAQRHDLRRLLFVITTAQ